MENYIDALRKIVDLNASKISTEDYDGYMGIADDAEEDPMIASKIYTYLTKLSTEQHVDIYDIDLSKEDCNDLLFLIMEE